jgi:hypothetical protein
MMNAPRKRHEGRDPTDPNRKRSIGVTLQISITLQNYFNSDPLRTMNIFFEMPPEESNTINITIDVKTRGLDLELHSLARAVTLHLGKH